MGDRIFFDTNPIIYLLEDHPVYADYVERFILQKMLSGCKLYTSVMTSAEFLCKPIANKEHFKLVAYHQFIDNFGFFVSPITESIAYQAAFLRAKYKGLKLPDALQLAASIEHHCDAFLTNDERLMRVTEAHVLYLNNL